MTTLEKRRWSYSLSTSMSERGAHKITYDEESVLVVGK